MKKVFVSLAFILSVYLLGFFTLTPLALNSPDALKPTIYSIHDLLYESWMMSISDDSIFSPVKEIHIKISVYWCERDLLCKVATPKNYQ